MMVAATAVLQAYAAYRRLHDISTRQGSGKEPRDVRLLNGTVVLRTLWSALYFYWQNL